MLKVKESLRSDVYKTRQNSLTLVTLAHFSPLLGIYLY